MKRLFIPLLSSFLFFTAASGQDTDRKIQFPDVEGYLTLKTDLHIHTVFSDGHVLPTIRIEEAVKDGLDAISLTEHIEYQPWSKDVPNPDRNRSYEMAKEYAKPHNLIVIHGSEITRDMPPGHANALFVTDANELILEDPMDAYKKAREQGAFIFWNHPNWINQQKDALPKVSDFHEELIKNDLLHGIEVVNDITFSDEGLRIALERGLTVIGTSDIHGLVDYQFRLAEGGHRPICLVFATERSEAGIKEALFAGRTVTWFENVLAGKEENVARLVDASLQFKALDFIGDSEVLEVEITNQSDARFLLQNKSVYDFYMDAGILEVEPHSQKTIHVITSRSDDLLVPLQFEVLNAVVGYKKNYQMSIPLNK